MKFTRIFFIINAVVFSIVSIILFFAICFTTTNIVGSVVFWIYIFALLFSIAQVIISISLAKVIKISSWTEENQYRLTCLIKNLPESQIIDNNIKYNNDHYAPKEEKANTTCQCDFCEHADKNNAMICKMYTTKKNPQFLDNSLICGWNKPIEKHSNAYDITLKECQCLSCEFNTELEKCMCLTPVPKDILQNRIACEIYSKDTNIW